MSRPITLNLTPSEAEMIRLSLVMFGDTIPGTRSGFSRGKTDAMANRVWRLIQDHGQVSQENPPR